MILFSDRWKAKPEEIESGQESVQDSKRAIQQEIEEVGKAERQEASAREIRDGRGGEQVREPAIERAWQCGTEGVRERQSE